MGNYSKCYEVVLITWMNEFNLNDIDSFFFVFVTVFQYYRCILLVPDIYNRQHIKEVVNMLLLNMGFSGIFRHI